MTSFLHRWPSRYLTFAIWVACAAPSASGCGKDLNGQRRAATITAAEKPAQRATTNATATTTLDYIERFTGGAAPDEALPMILGVHGLGDRPESFSSLYDALPFKARIILPRAPRPWYGGHTWFDIDLPFTQRQTSLAAGIASAADQVAALIDVLVKLKPLSGKPIVSGFSQGGMISFAIAIRHSEKVGVAVPVSGALPKGLWPHAKATSGAPKIRAFHGDADELVPIDNARKTIAHLKGLGFDAELTEYAGIPHALTDEMQRDLYRALAEAATSANRLR